MKPLNQKERRIAFMKFLGVFLLAIAIVIFSAFAAGVKVPPSVYSNQGQICNDRETLARYIDSLEVKMAVLKDLDKKLAAAATEFDKGEQMKIIQNEENNLTNLLKDIKYLKTDIPEKNALYNIGDAYLLLRTIAKKPVPVQPSGGSNKDDCEPWKNRLHEANEQIADLKKIAAGASKDLDKLKVSMINFRRHQEEIRNLVKSVKDDLDDAKNFQKIPEY